MGIYMLNPKPSYEELEKKIKELEKLKLQNKNTKKIQKDELFLQNVFDSFQDGILVIDKDINVVWVNKWVEASYGPLESLKGKKCYSEIRNFDSVCPFCPYCESF